MNPAILESRNNFNVDENEIGDIISPTALREDLLRPRRSFNRASKSFSLD
jgi:hypothetical protein